MPGGSDVRVTELCDLLQMKQTGRNGACQAARRVETARPPGSPGDGRVRVLKLTPAGRRRLVKVFDALRDDRAALTERFEELGVRFHASSS
jgi:hypothetical protein